MVSLAVAVVVALTGCADSTDSDASPEQATVDIAEVVDATSRASSITFSVDMASESTVVLSTSGDLDLAKMYGFRSDSAGIDGRGLDPIAEVWFESGNQFQSIEGAPAEPVNGGLASFLGTNGPQDLTSLRDVIAHWLGSGKPERPTREDLDGVVTTRFTLDRTGRTPLEVWVDSAHRLVQVAEVGDQIRPLTSTHVLEYPDAVTIPARP